MADPLTGTSIRVLPEPTPSEPTSGLQPGDKLCMFASLTEDLGSRGECWIYRNGQQKRFAFETVGPLTLRLTPLGPPSMFGSGEFENLERTTHGPHKG